MPQVVADFADRLERSGLGGALGLLNARTRYRFTGLYRVEPPWLRNVQLFDRENPSIHTGGDIYALRDTYCSIVAASGDPFYSAHTAADPRLEHRAARTCVLSYVGIPVRSPDGSIPATLCHFDVRPRLVPLGEIPLLERVAGMLAAWLEAGTAPVQ